MAFNSIANVHSMKDDRWLTKDKISQFRGLINLQTRDRKKEIYGASKMRRSQFRNIRALKFECKRDRATLDNTLYGNKRMLHNILQDHRAIQLTCQQQMPHIVTDRLDNNNFVKIKELDRLRHKKKQRMEVYANLRYELADLSESSHADLLDRSTRGPKRNLLNLTQRISVMQNAAQNIKDIYQSILTVLKKDSMYFDAVLNSLRHDIRVQCRCVIRATELGQLATEDLANLKDDIRHLEKGLKLSMRERDSCVKEVEKKAHQLALTCKQLVRGDDDEHLNKTNAFSITDIGLSLIQSENEAIMKVLQHVTVVSTFDDIFPRMEDQLRQRNRLLHQMRKGEEMRDDLLNMRNHAELMLSTLQHAMADITFKYKEDKQKLLQEQEELNVNMKHVENEFQDQGNLFCTLRLELQTLFEMLTRLREVSESEDASEHELIGRQADSSEFIIPPAFEEDALKLLTLVVFKFKTLVSHAKEVTKAKTCEEANKVYQQHIIDYLSRIESQDMDAFDYPLIEDNEVEDAGVLSRLEVKLRSQRLMAQFEKTDLEPIGPIQLIGRKKQHKMKKT